MTTAVPGLVPTTRPLLQATVAALGSLKLGERIRITHMVRISSTRFWPVTVKGTYRGLQSLVTGLATERLPVDDIIVPTVHFTKDNGELSCVTLDEQTLIEIEK
jgi:hypothetical protein